MPPSIVDVGIPVAGRSAFVGQAIESVLSQTLEEWSLTIAEDGAQPSAAIREAVGRYLDDPRIRFLDARAQLGGAGVKSTLIQAGTAPFVALLDDDDVWAPRFLERQVAFLQAHPEAGFVFCANTVIDSAGRETGRSRLVLAEGVHRPAAFVPRLLEHNLVATPTVLVRRSAYLAVGAAFDSGLPTSYDYEMSLRLALRFPVGYRSSWDASYREHGDQSTVRDRGLRAQDTLRLLDLAEAAIAASPEPIAVPREALRRQRAAATLSAALDRLEAGQVVEARRSLRAALQLSPRVVLDPRTGLVAAGLLLPGRARRFVGAARMFALRHGVRGGRLQRRSAIGQRPRRSR